jgi:hypothetical protein
MQYELQGSPNSVFHRIALNELRVHVTRPSSAVLPAALTARRQRSAAAQEAQWNEQHGAGMNSTISNYNVRSSCQLADSLWIKHHT